MSNERNRTSALLALWLLGTSALSAQPTQDAPPTTLGFTGEASVSWVLVPMTVHGPLERIRKLRREDFRLTIDGEPAPIMSFEAGPDAPIRLIYLQDLSGSMANARKLEASREALECFLEGARPADETALVSFASGETRLDVPFTSERRRLESAMAAWQGYGTTALHDAVARLPEMRASERSIRQAAVLVTDGGDNASEIEPEAAREIVRRSELPVYVFDLRLYEPLPGPPEATSYAHLLRLLASATGGRYRAVVGDTMRETCAEVLDELRFQYVLGFQTRESGIPSYRHIEVELVRRKPFRLSHRRGYTGHPPLVKSSANP